MGDPPRLWAALEAVPALCTAAAEWRSLLGEEYEAASRFLRPDGRAAGAVPCTSNPVCGCTHAVVEHGPDDIVSVCRCEPRECDTRALTRADILLHEVNRRALGDAVAAALGAVPEQASPPPTATTWGIGTCSPRAGSRFPVHLTVPNESADFRHAVDSLVAQAAGPFILVVPTRDLIAAGGEETLRRVKAHIIALAEEFVLDATGALLPRRPVAEILLPFLSAALPAPRNAPERWSGRPLTAKEAAARLGHASGAALLKATSARRVQESDPLYLLRQGGPGRTPGRKFYEDAVEHVKALLESAGSEYDAGVAKRLEQARAAKAATSRPDPEAAQRRFMQALERREKKRQ